MKINCMNLSFTGRLDSPRWGMSFPSATSKASFLPGREKLKVGALGAKLDPTQRQAAQLRAEEAFWATALPGKHGLDFTAESCKKKKSVCLSNA